MSLLTTASLVITPNAGKEGTLFSIIPDTGLGDMSVTRATTATRVNSAGLVELVPYNLVDYSQDFTNPFWTTYQSTITANNTTAPDGTLTATKVTASMNSVASVYGFGSYNEGLKTFSVYAKAGNQNIVFIDAVGIGGGTAIMSANLSTGTIISSTFQDQNIESVGNGWYLISGTYTDLGGFLALVSFGFNNSVSANDYAFFWGYQIVEAEHTLPYQKTETRLNIPRLDYSNGTCPSLLVEPQRTNLLTYSSSFDNAAWLLGNNVGAATITANNAIAPDGTLTADKVAFPAVGSPSQWSLLFRPFTASATSYSGSFYIKGELGTEVVWISFTKDGVNYTQEICNLTTEWQRFDLTSTLTAGADNFQLGVDTRDSSQTARPAQTIYIWGAQLEAGSYATSYIPTTSASVTRNADVISKTGISSLIGQTEGTLFVDVYRESVSSQISVFLSNSTGANAFMNSIYIYQIPNNIFVLECWLGNVQQFSFNTGGNLSVGRHKIAVAYKQNDAVAYIDGVLFGSDNSCNIPPMSVLDLNPFDTGFDNNTEFNSVALWKTRLTNTQLAQLTTI